MTRDMLLMILKDILVGSDILQSSIMIFQQGIHFQTDQLVQTHLEDCSGLTFCKIKAEAAFSEALLLKRMPSVVPVIRQALACLIFLLPRRISMISQ